MSWNHYTTPDHILERVRRIGPIGVDPCWNEAAKTNPRVKFDGGKYGCGLAVNWFDFAIPNDVIFVNHPFDDCETWRARCATMPRPRFACHLVALGPHNSDTLSWRHIETADAIATYRGRVSYGNAPPTVKGKGDRPRFATSLAYWGPDAGAFRDAFIDVASVSRFWGAAA